MEKYVSPDRLRRFKKHALRKKPVMIVEPPPMERVVLEPISFKDLGLGQERKVA
jgi:hypothetical protein